MRLFLLGSLAIGVALSVACAGPVRVTSENAYVETDQYALTAPADGSWSMLRASRPERLLIGRHPTEMRFQVDVYPTPLSEMLATVLDHSDQERLRKVAEVYQHDERVIMHNLGVVPGLYQLLDVESSEVALGGKTFYVMEYRRVFSAEARREFGGRSEAAALYLYFPPEGSKTSIFVALHRTVSADSDDAERLDVATFHAVLKTLSTR